MELRRQVVRVAVLLGIVLLGLASLPVAWAMPSHPQVATFPTRTPSPVPHEVTPPTAVPPTSRPASTDTPAVTVSLTPTPRNVLSTPTAEPTMRPTDTVRASGTFSSPEPSASATSTVRVTTATSSAQGTVEPTREPTVAMAQATVTKQPQEFTRTPLPTDTFPGVEDDAEPQRVPWLPLLGVLLLVIGGIAVLASRSSGDRE